MGTLFTVDLVKLEPKALTSSTSTEFINYLDSFDYGQNVALKAHTTFLKLLSLSDQTSPLEGQHSKDHLYEGFNKMFQTMHLNLPITSTPHDESERADFYRKLSKGFQFMGQLILEEFGNGQLEKGEVYSCLDVVGDGGHACAGRWRQVLEQLSIAFSEKVSQRLGIEEIDKDRFESSLNDLFSKARMVAATKLSEQFVSENFPSMSVGNKLHYTNFFMQYINFHDNLNLPVSMDADSFLSSQITKLNQMAREFLYEKQVPSLVMTEFENLFQDKINHEGPFFDLYLEYTKGIFHKKNLREKYEDVSDYLQTEVFLGYSKNINRQTLSDMLLEKGFVQFVKGNIDVENKTMQLVEQFQFDRLEKFFRMLPDEIFQNKELQNFISHYNKNGMSLIGLSLVYTKPSLAIFLLDKGADPEFISRDGKTPLIYASSIGHLDVAKKLIEVGADVNNPGRFHLNPLMTACANARPDIVRLLLENHADPNLQIDGGITALAHASYRGNTEIVKLLLETGANPNFQDKTGTCPLISAVIIGNKQTVELLLEHQADPNLCNERGISPLMLASSLGNEKIAHLLLAHGANPNLQNNEGLTALMMAASSGHTDIVKELIRNKADLQLKCSAGLDATAYAARDNRTEIQKLLAYGIRLNKSIPKMNEDRNSLKDYGAFH